MFRFDELWPVVPLGGTLVAAGYANRIYGARTETEDVPDTYRLQFRLAAVVLCKRENGQVIYATSRVKRVNSD